MGTIFVPSGPAEILRTVQKDRILYELIERHLTNILLKVGGTTVWLRHRQLVHFSSKFLYYAFTTLSGYQTLGEEYTNIVQVNESLRLAPSFMQRLLMSVFDACGFTFVEYMLNKIQRRVHQNALLHDEFKRKTLRCLAVIKAALPLIIHFHLVVFYWHGTFYDIAKRITGIRYILTKPWLLNDRRLYGFKILAVISMFHLCISVLHSVYKWFKMHDTIETSKCSIECKYKGKCSLCLETRTNTCTTTCGHLYCWYCICNWLQTSNQCPICRDVVMPSRIVPLQNYY